MSRYELKNDVISIEVDSLGAELKSLKRIQDKREYLWDANPAFWKRTSPVLFPLVGSLREGTYHYQGKSYQMSQHGFARDMEFTLEEQSEERISFVLQDTEETLAKYPFHFLLRISYAICGNTVQVGWQVENLGKDRMYFSIGGHPAFLCPVEEGTKRTDYYIRYTGSEEITTSVLGKNGLLTDARKTYPLDNGFQKVTQDLFAQDALIVENSQVQEVALCQADKKPYLTVRFDAPLFGVWSPDKEGVPFICIEPWYGRCDRENFAGELQDREWGNQLDAGEKFVADYTIIAE